MLLGVWLVCSAAFGQTGQPGAFVTDPSTGCKVWDPHPLPDESVAWSGGCVDGLAQGGGNLQWIRNGKAFEKDSGEWKAGRQSGRGTQEWPTGRYDGELVDGEPTGHGVMTLQSARYEGEFRNGKPNGIGAVTNLQGVFSGTWREGCLTTGKQKIAFAVSSATCR